MRVSEPKVIWGGPRRAGPRKAHHPWSRRGRSRLLLEDPRVPGTGRRRGRALRHVRRGCRACSRGSRRRGPRGHRCDRASRGESEVRGRERDRPHEPEPLPGSQEELPEPPPDPETSSEVGTQPDDLLGRDELPDVGVSGLSENQGPKPQLLGFRCRAQAFLELRDGHGIVPEEVGDRVRVGESRGKRGHGRTLPVTRRRRIQEIPRSSASAGRSGLLARRVGPVPIRDPFPEVPVHVVQSERVRQLRSDGHATPGTRPAPPDVRGHRVVRRARRTRRSSCTRSC